MKISLGSFILTIHDHDIGRNQKRYEIGFKKGQEKTRKVLLYFSKFWCRPFYRKTLINPQKYFDGTTCYAEYEIKIGPLYFVKTIY